MLQRLCDSLSKLWGEVQRFPFRERLMYPPGGRSYEIMNLAGNPEKILGLE